MIGSKIAEIRNMKGISLSKLARDAGISKGYLSNIENGIKENLSKELLEKIAKALGIDVSEFYESTQFVEGSERIEELEEDMKLLFSKAKTLSKEDRKKVLKMIEIFQEENNN